MIFIFHFIFIINLSSDNRKMSGKEWLQSLSPTSDKLMKQHLELSRIRLEFQTLLKKHNQESIMLKNIAEQLQKTDDDLQSLSRDRSINKKL